jgi:hypothetical protein
MSIALAQFAQPLSFGKKLIAGPAIEKLCSFRDREED